MAARCGKLPRGWCAVYSTAQLPLSRFDRSLSAFSGLWPGGSGSVNSHAELDRERGRDFAAAEGNLRFCGDAGDGFVARETTGNSLEVLDTSGNFIPLQFSEFAPVGMNRYLNFSSNQFLTDLVESDVTRRWNILLQQKSPASPLAFSVSQQGHCQKEVFDALMEGAQRINLGCRSFYSNIFPAFAKLFSSRAMYDAMTGGHGQARSVHSAQEWADVQEDPEKDKGMGGDDENTSRTPRPPSASASSEEEPSNSATKVRPAVVTVMGHVDHGKTSLLDALRQTSLAAMEAGGITQHLGAFVVDMPSGSSLTFLDTPGHAAFSAMRARGAAVTDIIVLVVAADDGVMPQTREAMSHAAAAKVPIVVAINKCDKPEADAERVRQQMAAEGLELEDIGGEVQVVEISATKHIGLEKLEEALLLQAEMMDLQARPDDEVHGVVVEARVDKGQGPLATVIIKTGTVHPGMYVVVGNQWGRVRALRDMLGAQITAAGPSTPVEIHGLKGVPEAGDEILVVANEEEARAMSQQRTLQGEEGRIQRLVKRHADALAAISGKTEEEIEEDKKEKREMTVLVKADVRGTAQAVSQALESLSSPQVSVNIVHSGVGPVSQSDIALAEACGACVVGFNVRAMAGAVHAAAQRAKIKVCQHRIIYHLLEDVGNMIVGMAPGTKETQVGGQAEILSIFEVKGKGRECRGATKIAGCRVVDGKLSRNSKIRVLRSGDVLFEGPCVSLRREKDDVETVAKGSDCGLVLKDWVDFQVGDVIQSVEDVRRMPKFVSSQSGAVRIDC